MKLSVYPTSAWPKLEEAVDLKIGEQRKFVAWWDANVTRSGPRKLGRGHGLIRAEAEQLTGMKHQRVSALGKRLKMGDKYRAGLLGASCQPKKNCPSSRTILSVFAGRVFQHSQGRARASGG